ncbi:MAG: DUF1207 domain-containing protein [Calditrichaeota bacterium]|nr:MAG: DUF1207 domain-containing protein [Calditrichota bacterium]
MRRLIFLFTVFVFLFFLNESTISQIKRHTITFPSERIFYRLLADPREVRFAMGFLLKRNEFSGNIGYSGGLVQFQIGDIPVQMRIESMAFLVLKTTSQTFPIQTSDFYFGLPFDFRFNQISARLKWAHVSSHLGDEIPRASEIRIDFSREFWQLLLSYDGSQLRFYGGFLWAYHVLPRVGPWTLQFGMEWTERKHFHSPYPYFAVDIKPRQEVGWAPDFNSQVGVVFGNHQKRAIRLALEYFNGHSNQGQFFQRKENDVNIVINFDF